MNFVLLWTDSTFPKHTNRYANERDVMYAALDAVMKLAIDSPGNRLRFGESGMCQKVMESFER